jgi:hypothetical protein
VKPDRGSLGVWMGFKVVTGLAAAVMIAISLLILFSKATTVVDTSKLPAGTRVAVIHTDHGPQATYDCPAPFDWVTGAPHASWCGKEEHSELAVGEPVVLAIFAVFVVIFLYAGRRRRRIREAAAVGVRLPGLGEGLAHSPPRPAEPFDPPPDDRRAVGAPDFILRPRLLAIVAATALWLGFLVPLTVIGYSEGRIDPRVPFYAVLLVVVVIFSVRARLTIADHRVRRAIGKREVVSLDRLAFVQVTRSKVLKQQGYMRTRLVIGDRYGRTIAIKPGLWRHGARRLLVLLDVCVRSQGIAVDDRTREHFSAAAPQFGSQVAGWAYAPAAPAELPAAPPVRRAFDRWWTCRDAAGTAKKAQPQRLVVIPLVLAFVPIMIVSSDRMNSALRSFKCDSSRHLWADADVPAPNAPPQVIAAGLQSTTFSNATIEESPLTTSVIAPPGTDKAVLTAVAAFEGGIDVGWTTTTTNGPTYVAEIRAEQFQSHAAALAYERALGDERCSEGYVPFTVSSIPGAAGFRCSCVGSREIDKVGFVRGDLGIQVIDWYARAGDHHRTVEVLADRAAAPYTSPPPTTKFAPVPPV